MEIWQRRYRNGSPKLLRVYNAIASLGVIPEDAPVVCPRNSSQWGRNTYYHPKHESKRRCLPRSRNWFMRKCTGEINTDTYTMTATCENCGLRCSFSVLTSADTSPAAAFVKASTERMSLCPNLIKNPHYREQLECGRIGRKFWSKWIKAQEPPKVKYPPGIRRTGNKLGGAVYH